MRRHLRWWRHDIDPNLFANGLTVMGRGMGVLSRSDGAEATPGLGSDRRARWSASVQGFSLGPRLGLPVEPLSTGLVVAVSSSVSSAMSSVSSSVSVSSVSSVSSAPARV